MADSCIQGDDFPAHILWDRSAKLRIRVKVPPTIQVKEVYNVPENNGRTTSDEAFEFGDFIVNGYIGFVFHAGPQKSTLVKEHVSFEIESIEDGSLESFSKPIYLFRPDIELVRVPTDLTIKYDANRASWHLNDKIRIRNTGAGTAVVEVQLIPEGDFELGTAANINEFQVSFVNDLTKKLDSLSKVFPQFSDVIQEISSLFKPPASFLDKDGKNRIKTTFEHLKVAVEEDQKFLDEFVGAILTAYLKNITLITELASFREYLDSIGEGRVIIFNSVSALKAKKPFAKLQMLVRITDLANNDYPPLRLPPINVDWEGGSGLPIHMLFDWRTTKGGRRVG